MNIQVILNGAELREESQGFKKREASLRSEWQKKSFACSPVSKPGHRAQANFLAIFIIYCKEQVGTKRNPPCRIISLSGRAGRRRPVQRPGPVAGPLTPA